MKDRNRIEEEVRKTLQSLEGIERVSPKPFLHTRIVGKIQKSENELVKISHPFYRLTYALLATLVVINVVTISMNLTGTSTVDAGLDAEVQYFQQYYPTLTTIENFQMNSPHQNDEHE